MFPIGRVAEQHQSSHAGLDDERFAGRKLDHDSLRQPGNVGNDLPLDPFPQLPKPRSD
jgi:hypothetical protein